MNLSPVKLVLDLSDRFKLGHALTGRPLSLPVRVQVGTHHKTGTVWMLKLFQQLCRVTGLQFEHGEGTRIPRSCDVYLSYSSEFCWQDSSRPCKGIHLIRDPRDVIVSSAFYHTSSTEAWLHVKRPEFGGQTYQEKINSYGSLDDRISFEMEHMAFKHIGQMTQWDYANPSMMEIKYEDLIVDENLLLFHGMFTFLEFPGQAMPLCLQVAYENSLFSGKVKKSSHVRSGQSRQWEKHLNAEHRRKFLELFGDALIKLGYETDHSWAN